jgi:hypothetical protein
MSPEEKKHRVEARLQEFERFFVELLRNEPLSRPERAILATYITWDLGLAPGQEQEKHAEEGSS